jgi:tetratricopeptide (TPR) repeat protein
VIMATRIRVVFFCLISINSYAAEKDQGKPTAPPEIVTKAAVGDQSMRLVYGSSTWNQDSTQLDSAFLFLRDRKSGKLIKIVLEETEPDSSVFSGSFAISLGKGAAVDPEVFIPPRTLRDNAEAAAKFNQLLSSGQVKGKPLVIHHDDGVRVIDVFDTPDQAKRAEKAYAEKAKDEKAQKKTELLKPAVKPQDLDTAKIAQERALLNKLAQEAAQREAERVRLEQIELQKAMELERQARALTEKQRVERRRQAAELGAEGMAHYVNGEFPQAEEKFKKSVELDPENKSYYLNYGIALYRNEKLNDAMVILKLAPDAPTIIYEKKFYIALIHIRFKEWEPALALMRQVSAQRSSQLAPSAAFYEGIILFTQEEYEKAKEPFERTIDISNDPKMDDQAEAYLESLIGLIKQQQALKKKWFFNGMVGLTYDSNVLLTPDSDTAGTATEEADIRLALAGDGEYRFKNTKLKEFGAKASAYYLRSSKEEVSEADPFLINLSTPYTHKGYAFGKGYKFALKPAYELVYMDLDEDGTRESILQSFVIGADNTFVMRNDWFSAYNFEFRQDDAMYPSSAGDDNADALKISLKTTQTFMLDKTNKRALIGNAGYLQNSAKGKEKYYDRIDIGVSYMQPTSWGASWVSSLNYYISHYAQSSDGRKDKNLTLSTGVTKPYNEWMSWMVMGSYVNNASTEDANHYSKYSIMGAAVFNYSL